MVQNQTENNVIEIQKEAGFAFVIIPILLVLFGFFVTGMLNETKPNQFHFEVATQEKMVDVKKALATYAHRNYRIPCPADPSLAGANLGLEDKANNIGDECTRVIGILPFRELGLPESAAKDEWGHYLTYKVSPDFTKQFSATMIDDFDLTGETGGLLGDEPLPISKNGGEHFVHELCRTGEWVDQNKTDYIKTDGSNSTAILSQNINRNLYKARFCCPSNLTGGVPSAPILASSYETEANDIVQKEMKLGTDNEITFSAEAKDAIKHRSKKYNDYWASQAPNEFSNFDLAYRKLKDKGKDMGDALGPFDKDKRRAGKFYRALAPTIQIDYTKQAQRITIGFSDIDHKNTGRPMQISMDIVDHNGMPIDTIKYTIQLPTAPQDGQGNIEFSINDILGEYNQTDLYHRSASIPAGYPLWRHNAISDNAQILFNDEKLRYSGNLNTWKTANPGKIYSIGRLKLNPSNASIGINSIAYTPISTATDTDLVIRKEDNSDRFALRRDTDASYGSSNSNHNGAITQDFEAAVYAVISHGPDGEGSYIVDHLDPTLNGTPIDNILDVNENPDERANHNPATPQEVRDVRKIVSTNQAEKFDDLVLWDSQITLYNSLNNGTCESSQSL